MSNDLFRHEVIEQRSTRWLGSVRLAQSYSVWMSVAVALLLATSLIAFLFIGSYAKKARVSGVLVPQGGEINVAAPELGRVAELRVKEGDSVQAGHVLMTLAIDRQSDSGETAMLLAKQIEARRGNLHTERELLKSQSQQRQHAHAERATILAAEIAKLEGEIALQQRRRDLIAQGVERYERLARGGFFSFAQVQQQQESLIEQDARLQGLERDKLKLQRDQQENNAQGRELGAQLAMDLSRVERDLLNLAQEGTQNEAHRRAVIVAPKSGVVTALAVCAGQSVASGQALATLVAQGATLEAHLFAPSQASGFISAGQPVLLRYAAYPYQKFGLQHGTVHDLSQSAFAPQELPRLLRAQLSTRPNAEALYRITVTLDSQTLDAYGKPQQLKPGMVLEADIVQDRRHIVEWMFEPLIALARRS